MANAWRVMAFTMQLIAVCPFIVGATAGGEADIPGLPPEKIDERNALPQVSLAEVPLPDAKLAKGEHHEIDAIVCISYPYCRFWVKTPHGEYNVTGIRRLLKCLYEIEALERFRATDDGSQVWKGAKESIKDIGRGVERIIEDPGESARAVGRGFARLGRSIARLARKPFDDEDKRRAGDGSDRSKGGKGFLYGGELRKFAYELGVDVYTDNIYLQAMMREVAKQRATGRLAGKLGVSAVISIPGSTYIRNSLTPGGLDEQAEVYIRDNDADELRRINRKLWKNDLGLDKDENDDLRRFLENPNYTPREATYARVYLTRMREVAGIQRVVECLAKVSWPQEAEDILAQLELLAAFHQHEKPFARFIVVDEILGGLVKDSCRIIFPLTVDILDDRPETRQTISGLARAARGQGGDAEIWLTGAASSSLAAYAKSQGALIRQQILRQSCFLPPLAAPAPAEVKSP